MILLLLLGTVLQLEEFYTRGEYDRVVELAPAMLAESTRTRADSIAVLELAAFSEVALGRNRDARRTFRELLDIEPGLELDPQRVSPKIRAVFDGVRREVPDRPEPASVDTVYRRRPVPLSVIIPGAAQFGQGRRGAGYALLGFGVVSAGGLVAGIVGYEGARRDYLAATGSDDIAARYATANNWYRARTVLIGTTTFIWLYNLFDAVRGL